MSRNQLPAPDRGSEAGLPTNRKPVAREADLRFVGSTPSAVRFRFFGQRRTTRRQRGLVAYAALLTCCAWLCVSGLLGHTADPVRQHIDTAVPVTSPYQP